MLFIYSITNMTMSDDIGEHSAGVSADGCWDWYGHGCPCHRFDTREWEGFGFSLSCPTFFFSGVGSLNFRVEGTPVNHASPGSSVRCCVFPCGDVHVKVLEVSFQGVFEALALSPYLPCPLTKLTIHQLLWYSGTGISGSKCVKPGSSKMRTTGTAGTKLSFVPAYVTMAAIIRIKSKMTDRV